VHNATVHNTDFLYLGETTFARALRILKAPFDPSCGIDGEPSWAVRRLNVPWITGRSAPGASLTRLCESPGMTSERTENSVLWQ
jgi:hypothetical protein